MSYICTNPESYEGELVGNGQCVSFVVEAAKTPPASLWKEGEKVRGNLTLAEGTAIATFFDGKYPNWKTGNHAAIYAGQDATGIWVYDQWKSQKGPHPVEKRHLRFKGGMVDASNNGDAFSVVE